MYQIFKSSNASCCSFLLYSHTGFYRFVAQICNCFCKTVEPCGVALRFALSRRNVMKTDHAHRFALSNPFLSSIAYGDGGWVYNPLESNLKRVFLCLDSGKNCVYCHSPYPLYIKKMRQQDPELAKGWGQIVTPLAIDVTPKNCTN